MKGTSGPLGGVDVHVSFTSSEVLVGVGREIDLATAPDLAAVLSGLLDGRHGSVVVDVAKVGFLGLAGLRVIEDAAARVAGSGGRLTVRSPSAPARRVFHLVGRAELVEVDQLDRRAGRLGPEQTVAATDSSGTVDGGVVHRLRPPPGDDAVVDGALRLVVRLARATVGGADGVSVSLHRGGRLRTVAASDETILEMDADQYATGEGPCVDASVQGHWFHATSLAQEARWPAFTVRARRLGINAILSNPLLAEDRPVGALNIYSRTSAAFGEKDQELAGIFAAEASAVLGGAGLGGTDDGRSVRLGEALRTRQTIAEAQGVLMERDGVGELDAYRLLRDHSQKTDQPLGERAADIVASTRRDRRAPEAGRKGEPWLAS